MSFINNLLYHSNIMIVYYNQCAFYCETINCIKKNPNQTFYCINLITCIAAAATTATATDTTTTAPTNAAADTAASAPNTTATIWLLPINCVHCNWQCRCCLLWLVATAHSSDTHAAFAATLFTSLLN